MYLAQSTNWGHCKHIQDSSDTGNVPSTDTMLENHEITREEKHEFVW